MVAVAQPARAAISVMAGSGARLDARRAFLALARSGGVSVPGGHAVRLAQAGLRNWPAPSATIPQRTGCARATCWRGLTVPSVVALHYCARPAECEKRAGRT
jgi:hypothetical protein